MKLNIVKKKNQAERILIAPFKELKQPPSQFFLEIDIILIAPFKELKLHAKVKKFHQAERY